MANKFATVFILLVSFSFVLKAQPNDQQFSLMFYNVENLFDVKDDSLTTDENFTPEGDLHWTYQRLNKKCLNISKAIIGSGGWKIPDILVLCEIENRYVLEKLISETPLKTVPYKIIHKESPDHRGIDVSAIYNSESFTPLNYQYYSLITNGKLINTREILYISGIVRGGDTLHIFGNHWPSRYSGLLETRGLREAAAELLKSKIDELYLQYKNPKIVVVGDFNENPVDKVITEVLLAKKPIFPANDDVLYNLFFDALSPDFGTLKYQSQWFLFDHIMVSGSLLNAVNGLVTRPENARISNLPILLENDEKFGGKKPFRTYYGFEYQGGFSDHLPVIITFENAN